MKVWPFGVALLGEASNHLMPHWLKTVVVNDEEKASIRDCQVGVGKASESESLMTCRKLEDGIETGVSMRSRDESGGNQFTGQAVSGIQATRARPAAFVRNGRRRVRIQPVVLAGERERSGRPEAVRD
jgi:hypothetical protein